MQRALQQDSGASLEQAIRAAGAGIPMKGVCHFLVSQQAAAYCTALRAYALAGSGAALQNTGMPPCRALSSKSQQHLQSSPSKSQVVGALME